MVESRSQSGPSVTHTAVPAGVPGFGLAEPGELPEQVALGAHRLSPQRPAEASAAPSAGGEGPAVLDQGALGVGDRERSSAQT